MRRRLRGGKNPCSLAGRRGRRTGSGGPSLSSTWTSLDSVSAARKPAQLKCEGKIQGAVGSGERTCIDLSRERRERDRKSAMKRSGFRAESGEAYRPLTLATVATFCSKKTAIPSQPRILTALRTGNRVAAGEASVTGRAGCSESGSAWRLAFDPAIWTSIAQLASIRKRREVRNPRPVVRSTLWLTQFRLARLDGVKKDGR